MAQPVAPLHDSLVPLDAPLGRHAKALFAGVLAIGAEFGVPAPSIDLSAATGAQALDAVHGLLEDLFPQLKAT
ncbi:hypothetical protein [Streptomyces sp. NPDC059271]|uniref:hypothetical protein n=1 Tax=Streptomyces sp. NPDC059271 TaxID=3346799 RepID=UPI0036950DA4